MEATHRITLDISRRLGSAFATALQPHVRALLAPPAAPTHAHVGATPEPGVKVWKDQACVLQQLADRQEKKIAELQRENAEQTHRAEDLSAKLDRRDEDLAGATKLADELLAERDKSQAVAAAADAHAAAGEAAAAAAFGASSSSACSRRAEKKIVSRPCLSRKCLLQTSRCDGDR